MSDSELDAILAWGAGDESPADKENGHPVEDADEIVGDDTNTDNDLEEREYSRALLSARDLRKLKADIQENGYMSIENVRGVLQQNTIKESQEARGENCMVDPETLITIDMRINYCVFIAGDNAYTRDELLEHYPFEALHSTPESVFAQQEIGVFPPKKYALESTDEGGVEYLSRDVGDVEEFIMIEDLVGRAARKNYKMKRTPIKVVKTKIYLAKERWKDFQRIGKLARAVCQFVPALEGSFTDTVKALPGIFGVSLRRGEPLAIQDAEGARLDRENAALAALETKARALKLQEDDLRRREVELYTSLGLEPPARPERDYMAEAAAGVEVLPDPEDSIEI